MSVLNGLIALLLNFFSVGAGYAFSGRFARAGFTLLICFAVLFLLSSLAAISARFMILAATGTLALLVFVGFDSFRVGLICTRRRWVAAGVYILCFLLCFAMVYLPGRRVAFYLIPSNLMEPTLFNGDRFALDRRTKDFHLGDLVAVEMEDQSVHVRRIQELKSDSVIVTTDSKVHNRTEELPFAALRGRVLWVFYSVDPETRATNWSRFFMPVN